MHTKKRYGSFQSQCLVYSSQYNPSILQHYLRQFIFTTQLNTFAEVPILNQNLAFGGDL